jgi:hypothetical protein
MEIAAPVAAVSLPNGPTSQVPMWVLRQIAVADTTGMIARSAASGE